MLHLLTILVGVLLFPWVGLAFLLWMAWLEDSLPASVRRTGRAPDPAPILAIRIEPATRATLPELPGQRQASEVARSTEPSLGGSTNR